MVWYYPRDILRILGMQEPKRMSKMMARAIHGILRCTQTATTPDKQDLVRNRLSLQ